MNESKTKTFTPVVDLTFRGAVSGKKYTLRAYESLSLDPAEVPHIDPRDLKPGVVARPQPEPRTQGASIDD